MRHASWQEQITEVDRKRLAGLWGAWTRALNQAAAAGQKPALAALGDAAVAESARPGVLPGAGSYRCRSIRVGSNAVGARTAPTMVDSSGFAPCTIIAQRGLLWFEQTGTTQRVAGTLYADDDRLVFLGSKALRGEMGVMPYGSDAARDQVGVLRPFGDRRWRLELPWPNWQANLEVIEILPA